MARSATAKSASRPAETSEEAFAPIEGVIPRVSIEAYCETESFADALRGAAADRRMVKTSLAVSMGGVARAAKSYSDASTPNLLIVESSEGGFGIFSELEMLAEVCDASTKVVVAAPSNDVTLYRELKRQGVDEYIVTPSSPMQVIDAISAIYAGPATAPMGKILAFVGSKGGVGSSTLAHNVAAAIARRRQKETIILDLDIEFGTAGLDFNQDPTRSILDALADGDKLDDVKLKRLLIEENQHLRILAAPSSLDVKVEIDEASITSLLDVLRKSGDYVVIDAPHGWTPWVRQALLLADDIVLVGAPDLASLRNVKGLYDSLKARRPNDPPPRIVLNQVGVEKRPEIPLKDYVSVLGAHPDLVLPYDAAIFGAASNGGQMLFDSAPRHKVTTDLDAFSDSFFSTTRNGRRILRSGSSSGGGPVGGAKKGGLNPLSAVKGFMDKLRARRKDEEPEDDEDDEDDDRK
ncbi:AAA family ATPase [Neomegalonema perideroedes]|uniref:AAA family ATPase n=1 Tax=Neomegalonema perideroedes TaxID=217219 RepID=UPI00035D7BA6|nr:AAA family ATPase [Neomegalonema perideroedes]